MAETLSKFVLENSPTDFTVLKGNTNLVKEEFFDTLERNVQIIDSRTYSRKAGIASIGGHYEAEDYEINLDGKRIIGLNIYINKDDFYFRGVDYTDLIPTTIRHEIFELWLFYKPGWSLLPFPKRFLRSSSNISHLLAVREQYRYANELGKAERLLEKNKALAEEKLHSPRERERFLLLHETAYKKAILVQKPNREY